MRTTLLLAVAAVGFISLLTAVELVARNRSLRPELGRKLAHISCGILAAALPFFLPFSAIVLLAAAFVPFMVASRRLGLFPLVHSAERSTYGEIYFPIGVLLVAALVPYRVEYAFGVLVLAVADALASLVGQRYGRRTYELLSATKTYVGSAVFLCTTMALGLIATQVLGELSGATILAICMIAAATTVVEALVGGGADNVVLPISAAAMLRAMT
ncbi:MAG: diacylglycerol/polyprenol kinase family protein [Actinomycetota bacterium]